MNGDKTNQAFNKKPHVVNPHMRFGGREISSEMPRQWTMFTRWLVVVMGICIWIGGAFAAPAEQNSSETGNVLINGKSYGPDVCWNVTLMAGSAGSLFGDTLGPVRTFRYETVVTVDGEVKKVIPGGTYSTDMYDSSYNVKIPLKDLGLLEPEAVGTHYLTAFTRSYEGNSTVDIGYSLVTEDITLIISLPPSPELRELDIAGVLPEQGCVSTSSKQRFLVAGKSATFTAKVVNFNPEYYSFKSADLIGTPFELATREHRYVNGTMLDNEHIVFTPTLDAGRGFHGKYTWKVKAVFVSKIDGGELTSESNPDVEEPVFFKKYGQDNAGTPNWFTYWKEDGACPNLKVLCDAGLITSENDRNNLYGSWYDNTEYLRDALLRANRYDPVYHDGLIHIQLQGDLSTETTSCFGAAGCHYDRELEFVNKDTGKNLHSGGKHIYGIYTVEEVLAHELQHREAHHFYNGCRKHGHKDSDCEETRFEDTCSLFSSLDCEANAKHYGVFFCDFLVDWVETQKWSQFKLNKKSTDTYNVHDVKKWIYKPYGDDEILAMMAANKATDEMRAVLGNDWAFPGEQSCIPSDVAVARRNIGWPAIRHTPSTQLNAQVQALMAKQNQPNLAVSETATEYTPPSITLNEMSKKVERNKETALVTVVSYTFDMKVERLNKLRLAGVMTDNNGDIVAYANTVVSSGNVSAELRFSGNDIYESRREGPFRLDRVELAETDGIDAIDLATLSKFENTTVDLRLKDFVRGDAYLLEAVVETVTTNGIVLPVNVEVNAAGAYEITATLAGVDGAHVASASVTTNCDQGTNRVNVVFSAKEIMESGIDGPYTVDNIALAKDGVRVDSWLDFCVLSKKYRAQAFDLEGGVEIDSEAFMAQFEDYTPPIEVLPPERFWVFFNPNGGMVPETTREVIGGKKVGTLPVPTSENDEFLGWYTELEGGAKITDSTLVTTNMMFHAHWKNGGGEGVSGDEESGGNGSSGGDDNSSKAPTLFSAGHAETAFMGDATYNGWVRNADGSLAGLLTVKAAKAAKPEKGGQSKLTITYTPFGGKKQTIKLANDAMPVAGGVATVAIPGVGTVKFTGDALVGVNVDVQAGKDMLKSRDKGEKAAATAAAASKAGVWTFALGTDAGYAAFSVTVDKKGKGKLAGTLPDGTKVSVSAQGVLGDGVLAIPFTYAKKGTLGFVFWVKGDGTAALSDLTGGAPGTARPTIVAPSVSHRLADGEHTFTAGDVSQVFAVAGKKWNVPKQNKRAEVDPNPTGLKLAFTEKTGVVKGTFTVVNGKAKTKYTVVGAVVGGRFYGSAYVRNAAPIPATTE